MTPIRFDTKKSSIDWLAFGVALALALLGALTMNSFQTQDPFFWRQVLWISVGVAVFFIASGIDWRFLRRGSVAAALFFIVLVPLVVLVVAGTATKGAKSWFDLGGFALQPVKFVKLALIIALAKYFSRRHIEIANIRHILISGAYAAIVV